MTSALLRLGPIATLAALLAPPIAHAQAAAAATTAAPSPQSAVNRADLALAYLAFDQALTHAPPAADRIGPLSQAFDQATLAFFAGRNADAVRAIHGVTRVLQAGDGASGPSVHALRMTVEPHVLRRGAGTPPVLRAVLLYGLADSGSVPRAITFGARLVSDGGRVLATVEVPVPVDAVPGTVIEVPLPAAVAGAPKGHYAVMPFMVPPGGNAPRTGPGASSGSLVPASDWFVADEDLDAKRDDLARKAIPLDTIVPLELADAITTFKARVRLLTTRANPLNTAQWRAHPVALAPQLDLEFQQLMTGVDPYANRAGKLWRVIRTPARNIPLVTYVPVAVARDRTPVPLLIAIHGVGGDENMFPDALGAGRILALADQHGFVVASPNGDQFTTPADFDRLVEQTAAQVPIDKRRIWIVGHSRGAGQALALASARRDAIAGVVCIAGFGGVSPDRPIAPTLVVLGELDPLAQPARVAPRAEQAKAAGLSVDVQVLPQLGHTTVVAVALPEAVRWLLAHTLPPVTPERR